MKYLKKDSALCTGCLECEKTCSLLWFKEDNAEKSSIRIKKNTDKNEITVCSQCGECIDICPVQAIYRDKTGVVRVKKDICVGCFMCVGFCPEGAMFMHEDYIEPFKCTACGQCEKTCPSGAICIAEKQEGL